MPTEDFSLRLYGRAKGHALKPRQAKLVDELLPGLGLPPDISARSDIVPDEKPLWLEIGFGGAEHLIAQARQNPDVRLIGIEPYLNGVAKALAGIEDFDLKNVLLERGDARLILQSMPDAILDRVFILYPDPWPKKRHHKRRLVQPDFVAELARLIRPGGCLRFASDIDHYQAWALARILDSDHFDWTAERADDWRMAPDDHFPTRYEGKAKKAGRPCVYLDFVRND
ncbi:MAG: tRNA (guanosine(46)-N7)-methyltransferase TrmB [Robiginitomaculum sp.]|nr:MAG: tRNA (guanosine(46)-N7)-methyltransferase TrmB [Robiginitomaculum sp.]